MQMKLRGLLTGCHPQGMEVASFLVVMAPWASKPGMKTTHCACKASVEKKSKPGSQAEKDLLQEEREKLTGFREKPALSFYSQPFSYLINGELSPRGRGPQFIFSPQLGSCGHIVEGVSWSGGHIVLRNWHQQRKTGYCLKEETGCPPGPGGRCDFIPCLSGRHNGPYFNYNYKPLVNPNIPAFLI